MIRATLGIALALAIVPAVATAEGIEFHTDLPGEQSPASFEAKPQPHVLGIKYLYINRCAGGCVITKGTDDARTHSTAAPDDPGGTKYNLSEFAHGDESWNEVMQCLREVYSPYDIIVTDQPPPAGVPYNEGIAAGTQRELNLSGLLGYAYNNQDCSPRSYALSFTFANEFSPQSINGMCRVVAQETAHSFGLTHSFEFTDGRSACNDPMSYRTDCGGRRFFRNDFARCGEYEAASCGGCGGLQNTHQKLLNILGPGTPLTAKPDVTLTSPQNGATVVNGSFVGAQAFSERGIFAIELWLNGYKWNTVKGASWGSNGQAIATYQVQLPADVPDGVIDIVVKAKDDIELTTETPVITVTKGSPCASADTCAAGQRCEAGKCFWDAPVGEVGDVCTFEQFCKTGVCTAVDSGEQRCSVGCVQGIADSCPMGFTCLETADVGGGLCWPSDDIDTGCGCSSGGELPVTSLFGLGLVALLFRRRRR
ncbi:MAG: hypothetical protein H0V17_05140 [Deltaproteobacteria bacterium]|nr:hypothetical protein [Deltaproteobacteria bacterium]